MKQYQLHCGDCLRVMPTLGRVDAVITDPPYGIGYASSWTTRLGGEHRINRPSFGKDEFSAQWVPYAWQLLEENTYLFCFTRWDVLPKWKQAFEREGFRVAQRLIWDKCHWKMGDLSQYGSQVEDVLVLRKGVPEMFPGGTGRRGNVFRYSSGFLPEGQYDHPTQKPERLIMDFLEDGTTPDDIVLDPFMGSGTTGVACMRTGRRFIGIELDPHYFAVAERRIADAARQARGEFRTIQDARSHDDLPLFAAI